MNHSKFEQANSYFYLNIFQDMQRLKRTLRSCLKYFSANSRNNVPILLLLEKIIGFLLCFWSSWFVPNNWQQLMNNFFDIFFPLSCLHFPPSVFKGRKEHCNNKLHCLNYEGDSSCSDVLETTFKYKSLNKVATYCILLVHLWLPTYNNSVQQAVDKVINPT